jgi:hypothetical protein
MGTEAAGIREKRELVDRVSNSPTFQRSPRLREFLLYVADCTINEQLDGVREQQIAVNVFNRKPDYNPGQDNIVRVEARNLRKRLEAYFAAEGQHEPVLISMPKGSYSICFESRPVEAEAPVAIAEMQNSSDPPPPTVSSRMRWFAGVFAAAAIILLGMFTVRRPTRILEASVITLPFSALIDAGRDTYIVTSDSGLVLVQDLRRRRIDLDDYITRHYMDDTNETVSDPPTRALIHTLLKRRYTNAAETAIAGKIIQSNSWASHRIFLRSGHGVQLSDFKNNNAILFGTPVSNPWAALFSEKLNFQFDWDENRKGIVRNRSPRPGERSVYSTHSNPGESGSTYSVVAFVPNVNGEGHVLLVAGTTSEGTEAAGEFITDEKRATAALREIGINPRGPPRYFEILLEARTIAGSASHSSILASRLIPDAK